MTTTTVPQIDGAIGPRRARVIHSMPKRAHLGKVHSADAPGSALFTHRRGAGATPRKRESRPAPTGAELRAADP